MATVGLLHPGAMGATLARGLAGAEVLWCPDLVPHLQAEAERIRGAAPARPDELPVDEAPAHLRG